MTNTRCCFSFFAMGHYHHLLFCHNHRTILRPRPRQLLLLLLLLLLFLLLPPVQSFDLIPLVMSMTRRMMMMRRQLRPTYSRRSSSGPGNRRSGRTSANEETKRVVRQDWSSSVSGTCCISRRRPPASGHDDLVVLAAATAAPWDTFNGGDDDDADHSSGFSASGRQGREAWRFDGNQRGLLLDDDDDDFHRFSNRQTEPTESSWKDLWGVERRTSHSFPFPLDVSTLAEQIVAVAWTAMMAGRGGGTNECDSNRRRRRGKTSGPATTTPPPPTPTTTTTTPTAPVIVAAMDPNVQNALLGDRLFGRRPVRHAVLDAGRIGIEIDGPTSVNVLHVALRVAARASLVLQQTTTSVTAGSSNTATTTIPVALYFDSVRETLAARELLQRLLSRKRQAACSSDYDGLANVEILSLTTNNGGLPATMTMKSKTKKRRGKRRVTGSAGMPVVDPTRGIIIVVRPTDGGMGPLQRLTALATWEELPVVLLSPRMAQDIDTPYDQSGYQQSAAYGGREPPTGPTPWLMRDFWPPVYSWVWNDEFGYSYSILHQKQSWDIFDCSPVRRPRRSGTGDQDESRTSIVTTKEDHDIGELEEDYCCTYLASTVNCAGRPTREILRMIANEYGQSSSHQSSAAVP